jgi:hypothetical protein
MISVSDDNRVIQLYAWLVGTCIYYRFIVFIVGVCILLRVLSNYKITPPSQQIVKRALFRVLCHHYMFRPSQEAIFR